MGQQAATQKPATVNGSDHGKVMAEKFGSPEKLGDRFRRAVEGLFVVSPVDGMDGTYQVERDGSDHVYEVNVGEMECDCGDKKGLCKHLWRVMFVTGNLPEIDVNVAATDSSGDGGAEKRRPPTHIVLTDEQLAQMVKAASNLNMDGTVERAFGREDGVHVGELTADERKKVLDTLDMALGTSGFDGPTTEAEHSAALAAKEALQAADPL